MEQAEAPEAEAEEAPEAPAEDDFPFAEMYDGPDGKLYIRIRNEDLHKLKSGLTATEDLKSNPTRAHPKTEIIE
jgi:hypothetical protein